MLSFQSGDDNPFVYSTPNSGWEVLEDFEPGQIIEIDIIFTNYHWVSDDDGAVCTTSCFGDEGAVAGVRRKSCPCSR